MTSDLHAPPAGSIGEEDLIHALFERRLLSTDRLLVAQRHAQEQRVELRQALVELHLVGVDDMERVIAECRAAQVEAETPAAPEETEAAEPVGDAVRVERDIRAELRAIAESAVPSDLVEQMLLRALAARATDVHIDPREGYYHIRFRIDGKLHSMVNLDSETGQAVVRGIKVLTEMNLVESRHPQDGSMTLNQDGVTHNLRISTLPTSNGEKIVLRIHEPRSLRFDVNTLGLEPHQATLVNQFLARPYGTVLVGGPVGAGKTTTLYSCLERVTHPSRNVVTIEDPVECRFDSVNQVEINPLIGLNFAQGLRAILRQDPDVLMIGEIRDDETASIGIRAALTGVLVFSSIHASDAASTIGALFNYGIPGYTLSSALQGIINQRLVRRICPNCREPYQADGTILRALKLDPDEHRELQLYRGTGCNACFHTGYRGRVGIFEVMEISDLIRELILLQSTREVINQVARDEGMKTLRDAAIAKVIEGATTVEEMYRMTI